MPRTCHFENSISDSIEDTSPISILKFYLNSTPISCETLHLSMGGAETPKTRKWRPLKSSGKWRGDVYLAFRDNYRAIISPRLNVNHPSQVIPHGDGIHRHLNGREVIRMPIVRHHQHRLDALSAHSILGLQQPPCHAFRSFQRAAASVRVTTPCRTREQDHKEQANKNGGSVMHTEQNAPYNLLSDSDPPSLPPTSPHIHDETQASNQRSNLSPPLPT